MIKLDKLQDENETMSDKMIGSHIDLLADDQSVPQSLSQESGIYTKDGTKKKNNRA